MKNKPLFLLLFLLLVWLGPAAAVLALPVEPLPDDNLITNPWFRNAGNTTGSHDGWTVDAVWGLSQKDHNPTPDGVQGTAVRLGEPKASPGVDSFVSQVAAADAAHTILRFQTWQVSRNLREQRVTIYGGETADGPWTELWRPWLDTNSSIQWVQTPLFETTLERGWPFYKVEFMCHYGSGTAGCKYTGVYFTASSTSLPAAVQPTAVSAGAAETTPEPAPEAAENGQGGPAEAAGRQGLAALSAAANSHSEIELTWGSLEDAQAQLQIERSTDERRGWTPLALVDGATTSFVDAQLTPGVTYYYRIQSLTSLPGRSRSAVVSAQTAAAPAATAEIAAAVEPTVAAAVDLPPAATAVPETAVPAADDAPAAAGALAGFAAGVLLTAAIAWLLVRRFVTSGG